MKALSSMIAGAAMLGLANIAGAAEPMTLTDAQLDNVVAAGSAWVNAYASGDAFVYGDFYLSAYPGYGYASIWAEVYPYGPSRVSLSAGASSY